MTVEERFEKLEGVMDRLAERTAALDEAMVSLAESAEVQYRMTQEQFRRTDVQILQLRLDADEQSRQLRREAAERDQKTDEQIRQLRVEATERDQKTDKRITALVSAIGALTPRL